MGFMEGKMQMCLQARSPTSSQDFAASKLYFRRIHGGNAKMMHIHETRQSQDRATWKPPSVGLLKINVDGVVSFSAIAAAAIARDERGRFVASQVFLQCGYLVAEERSILAETHAIHQGVLPANHLNADGVVVEGDSAHCQ